MSWMWTSSKLCPFEQETIVPLFDFLDLYVPNLLVFYEFTVDLLQKTQMVTNATNCATDNGDVIKEPIMQMLCTVKRIQNLYIRIHWNTPQQEHFFPLYTYPVCFGCPASRMSQPSPLLQQWYYLFCLWLQQVKIHSSGGGEWKQKINTSS